MFFVVLFEIVIVIVIVVSTITQVVIPLWRGTAIFPIFHPERKLAGELAEANQEGREADLKKEIRKVKTRTTNKEGQGTNQFQQ